MVMRLPATKRAYDRLYMFELAGFAPISYVRVYSDND